MPSLPSWQPNSCSTITCQAEVAATESRDGAGSTRLDRIHADNANVVIDLADSVPAHYAQFSLHSLESILERHYDKLQFVLEAKLNNMEENLRTTLSAPRLGVANILPAHRQSGVGTSPSGSNAVATPRSGDAMLDQHEASFSGKQLFAAPSMDEHLTGKVDSAKSLHSSGAALFQLESQSSNSIKSKGSPSQEAMLQSGNGNAEDSAAAPARKKPLIVRFVHSSTFDIAICVVVCLNILTMFLQLEKNGMEAGEKLQLNERSMLWSKTTTGFVVLEHCFNTIFVVELILRLSVDGCRYLRSLANFFDAFVVVSTCLDAYLLKMVMDQQGGANMSFARMARLMKLLKFMRAFRAAAMFSELRVLVKTLISSMMALVWSAVLLAGIIMAAGIFMAQLMASFIEDESSNKEARIWIHRHYGTGSKAMYTMFEATLSGGWPNYARPMMEEVSWWYAVFWTAYVMIVVFAVIRVITALFLQKTMEVAKSDEEMMCMQKMKAKQAYLDKIQHFLHASDADGNGQMDKDELQNFLGDAHFETLLQGLGLEMYEVIGMFTILDDGAGCVGHGEFIAACMRLSGGPRAIDSVLVMHEQHKLKEAIDTMSSHFDKLFENVLPA